MSMIISKGANIKNCSFEHSNYFETTLSSNYMADMDININDDPIDYVIAGDKLVIGPSTNSTDEGKREIAEVDSTTASKIVITSALTYDYDDTDKLVVMGSNLGSDWLVYTNAAAGGINQDGKYNHHSQKVVYTPGDNAYLYQEDIPCEGLQNFKLSFYYKASSYTAGDLRVQVKNETTAENKYSAFTANDGSYTLKEITDTFASSGDLFSIYLREDATQTSDFTLLFDEIYLGDNSSDKYTFAEDPDLRSIHIDRAGSGNIIDDTWGRPRFIPSALMQKEDRLIVNCRFSYVSTDMYNSLQDFMYYQRKGYVLNWYPGLSNLPSVLKGWMWCVPQDFEMWDLGKCSFDFRFLQF